MKDNSPHPRSRSAGGGPSTRSDKLTSDLQAFEKISAVEGIVLSRDMKRDLVTVAGGTMTGTERTRFITDKYGKK